MTRTSLLFVLFVTVAACNKPSDSACRKAITNMRELVGTDSPTNMTDIEGDVRRCKGGSTKKAVECAGNAKSLDELRACEFMKIPPKTDTPNTMGSSAGSAAGSAGSDMGSASAGSAAGSGGSAGSSDMGSASAGSAAGSAAAGSAAAGSAAGSAATGSASAGSAAGSAK